MPSFDNFIKIGVKFPKKDVRLPSGWPDLKESIYNGEENYAVLTGKVNDVIVIDLDFKEETFIGLIWFRENFGEFDTLTTRSINGGYHIYFKYTSEISKKIANKDLHIDILSTGSCCYQGKKYNIVSDNPIRELTKKEISIIKELKNKKQDKNCEEKSFSKLNKIMEMPDITEWSVVKKEKGGHKATPL